MEAFVQSISYTRTNVQQIGAASIQAFQYTLGGSTTAKCTPQYKNVDAYGFATDNEVLQDGTVQTLAVGTNKTFSIAIKKDAQYMLHSLKLELSSTTQVVRVWFGLEAQTHVPKAYELLSAHVSASNFTLNPVYFDVQTSNMQPWLKQCAWFLQIDSVQSVRIQYQDSMSLQDITTPIDSTTRISLSLETRIWLVLSSSLSLNLLPTVLLTAFKFNERFFYTLDKSQTWKLANVGQSFDNAIYLSKLPSTMVQYQCSYMTVDGYGRYRKRIPLEVGEKKLFTASSDIALALSSDKWLLSIQLFYDNIPSAPLLVPHMISSSHFLPAMQLLAQKYISEWGGILYLNATEFSQRLDAWFFTLDKRYFGYRYTFLMRYTTSGNTWSQNGDFNRDSGTISLDLKGTQYYQTTIDVYSVAADINRNSYVVSRWIDDYVPTRFALDQAIEHTVQVPSNVAFQTLPSTLTVQSITYPIDDIAFLLGSFQVTPKYRKLQTEFPGTDVTEEEVGETNSTFLVPSKNANNLLLSALQFSFGYHWVSDTRAVTYDVSTVPYTSKIMDYEFVKQTAKDEMQVYGAYIHEQMSQFFWYAPLRLQMSYTNTVTQTVDVLNDNNMVVSNAVSDPILRVLDTNNKTLLTLSLEDEYVLSAFQDAMVQPYTLDNTTQNQSVDTNILAWAALKYGSSVVRETCYVKLEPNTYLLTVPLDQIFATGTSSSTSVALFSNSRWLKSITWKKGQLMISLQVKHVLPLALIQSSFDSIMDENITSTFGYYFVQMNTVYDRFFNRLLWNLATSVQISGVYSDALQSFLTTAKSISYDLIVGETQHTYTKTSVPAQLLSNLQEALGTVWSDSIHVQTYPNARLVLQKTFEYTTTVVYQTGAANCVLCAFPQYEHINDPNNLTYGLMQVLQQGTYSTLPLQFPIQLNSERRLKQIVFQFSNWTIHTEPFLGDGYEWNVQRVNVHFATLNSLQATFETLCKARTWCSLDGQTIFWKWKELLEQYQTDFVVSKMTIGDQELDLKSSVEVVEYASSVGQVLAMEISKDYWDNPMTLQYTFEPISQSDFFSVQTQLLPLLSYSLTSDVSYSPLIDWDTSVFGPLGTLQMSALYTTSETSDTWIPVPLQSLEAIPTKFDKLVLASILFQFEPSLAAEVPIHFLPSPSQDLFLECLHNSLEHVFTPITTFFQIQTLHDTFCRHLYWNAPPIVTFTLRCVANGDTVWNSTWELASTELERLVIPFRMVDFELQIAYGDEQQIVFAANNVVVNPFASFFDAFFPTLPPNATFPLAPSYRLFGTSEQLLSFPSKHLLVLPTYVYTDPYGALLDAQQVWQGTVVELQNQTLYNATTLPLFQCPAQVTQAGKTFTLFQIEFAFSETPDWNDVFYTAPAYSIYCIPKWNEAKPLLKQELQISEAVQIHPNQIQFDPLVVQQTFQKFFWKAPVSNTLRYELWQIGDARTLVWSKTFELLASSSLSPVAQMIVEPVPEMIGNTSYEIQFSMYDTALEFPIFNMEWWVQHAVSEMESPNYRVSTNTVTLYTSKLMEKASLFGMYKIYAQPVYVQEVGTLLEVQTGRLEIPTLQTLTEVRFGYSTTSQQFAQPPHVLKVYCKPEVASVQKQFRLRSALSFDPLEIEVNPALLRAEYDRWYWNLAPRTQTLFFSKLGKSKVPLHRLTVFKTSGPLVLHIETKYPDGTKDVLQFRIQTPHPRTWLKQLASKCWLERDDPVVVVHGWPCSSSLYQSYRLTLVPFYGNQPTPMQSPLPLKDKFGNRLRKVCLGWMHNQTLWEGALEVIEWSTTYELAWEPKLYFLGETIPVRLLQPVTRLVYCSLISPECLKCPIPFVLESGPYYTKVRFPNHMQLVIFHQQCQSVDSLWKFQGARIGPQHVLVLTPALPLEFETKVHVYENKQFVGALEGTFQKVSPHLYQLNNTAQYDQ